MNYILTLAHTLTQSHTVRASVLDSVVRFLYNIFTYNYIIYIYTILAVLPPK